jgi:hypothetical protein
VKAVNKTWSASWRGGGLVIALPWSEHQVRGVDFSRAQDESLAHATQVYRTLPSGVDPEGTDGGAYVVVDPSDRYELTTRILAHEFTHVACAAYGPFAPTWLLEGAARYVESLPMPGVRDFGIDKYRRLFRSTYLSKANTLPSDERFYEKSDSSYTISWLAVDYLVGKYGEGKVVKLYQELALRGSDQNQRDRIMTARIGRTEQQLFADLKRS